MLRIESLNKSFAAPVLRDFSHRFPEKGIVLLKGASGGGKTTLLRLIAGLEKPDSGRILLPEGAKISMVFQEARLVPNLTVSENLLLVAPEKDKKEAEEILFSLGLSDAFSLFPAALSGGMKERVNLARSIFYGGTIYLWDEPTKELDEENAKKVIEWMKKLSQNALVIAATHDEAVPGDEVIEL